MLGKRTSYSCQKIKSIIVQQWFNIIEARLDITNISNNSREIQERLNIIEEAHYQIILLESHKGTKEQQSDRGANNYLIICRQLTFISHCVGHYKMDIYTSLCRSDQLNQQDNIWCAKNATPNKQSICQQLILYFASQIR